MLGETEFAHAMEIIGKPLTVLIPADRWPEELEILARLKKGESAEYMFGAKRHGYLVPATGAVEVNGVRLDARDGAAIANEESVKVTALDDAEIVLVDTA